MLQVIGRMLLRGALIALATSSTISSALVSFNVYLFCGGMGECFEANLFKIWPRSFLVAYMLAIPIALFVAPFMVKITNKILDKIA